MNRTKVLGIVGIVCTFLVIAGLQAAAPENEKPSVQSLPPVVVKTVPESGDTQVDAEKTKEIRVTFSKKMADRSWSWSSISEGTELPIKDVRYEDDYRTCVATVELKPGQTYVSWLNSDKFQNFKDADGRPAVPYLLVFETRAAK